MGMSWTKEQEKVISLRNRNILVSAAAGSGKTAVLVQRILEKIMDRDNPVDIDRLLIMTFTRAAAGEMKERISRALEKALCENPENEHLQRQVTLIHTAQITTIDGFCAYVIRNYFHLIGLDPGYRTADEGELKLLKEDVLKNLMEDAYAHGGTDFQFFVDCYSSGKTDEGVKELILKLYDASMSNPYPDEWLDECLNSYKISDEDEINNTVWMKLLWDYAKQDIQEAAQLAEEAKRVCLEPGGPWLYEEAIDEDLLLLARLQVAAEERDYDHMVQMLSGIAYARLSAKKMQDVEERKKEQVKELRENMKSLLKELQSRYFPCESARLKEISDSSARPVEMLINLTKEFADRFAAAKREDNLLDFTDMEHFALEILVEKKDGVYHMSEAARELSMKYDEVMVDEYQDSNLVQELLTTCVSGWAKKRNNIFMVGDVKQSIYRFRLACPELFMEKYKSYTAEDSPRQRIDLHKNFRSRQQVLDSVNYVFRQIMGEDLGGITYDDAAALYPGAVFPEGENPDFVKTEVLLVEKDGEELEDEQGSKTARELEALAVSRKIREIVGKQMVTDKETGQYRPVEYRDIVILLRTASGWAETFSEVLSSQGIPSYTVSKTGYFSAPEVVTVLNYLKICDNPRQDIPLAGILRSPIVGCTSQEMALIRGSSQGKMLYDCVLEYLGDGQLELFAVDPEKEQLKARLEDFREQLEKFRQMAAYTPVHQMVLRILRETGYGNYVKALPDGAQRSANLSMLVEKALDYEKTSYRGVFNFVRYIEHLHKYDVDFGEVNLDGAGKGAVQIMTIHKSKGLEFPVVIAAGMGKQFNFQDVNARLLIHPDLGIGADAIFPEERIIVSSVMKQVLRRQILTESLGEELRVLYVAMTRAREKLILTGTVGKLEKQLLELERFRRQDALQIPLGVRMKSRSYWSFLLPVLARHSCMDELFDEYKIFAPGSVRLPDENAQIIISKITASMLMESAVVSGTENLLQKECLEKWDFERVYDPHIREQLHERFDFQYPFGYLRELPVKVSVSELKKRSYHDSGEKEETLFFEPDIVPLIPAFMGNQEEAFTGASRGTSYHRVMECLDYGKTETDEMLREQIEELVLSRKLQQEQAECVRVQDLRRFLDSSLGQRMTRAALDGRLCREQPFVIARPAGELDPSWSSKENVLIQGIIDAFFYEGDEIVLTDYKTDYILAGQEQKLIDMYHVQLEDYALALERMTKKRVKEIYIYSFTLGKAILL